MKYVCSVSYLADGDKGGQTKSWIVMMNKDDDMLLEEREEPVQKRIGIKMERITSPQAEVQITRKQWSTFTSC